MKKSLILNDNYLIKIVRNVFVVIVLCVVGDAYSKNLFDQPANAPQTSSSSSAVTGTASTRQSQTQTQAALPANLSAKAKFLVQNLAKPGFMAKEESVIMYNDLSADEKKIIDDRLAYLQKEARKQKKQATYEELQKELKLAREQQKRLAMQLARQQGAGFGLGGLYESFMSNVPFTGTRSVRVAQEGLRKQAEDVYKYPNMQSVIEGIKNGEFNNITNASDEVFKKALTQFESETQYALDALIAEDDKNEKSITAQVAHLRKEVPAKNDEEYIDALEKTGILNYGKAIMSEYLRARDRIEKRKLTAPQQQQGVPPAPAAPVKP